MNIPNYFEGEILSAQPLSKLLTKARLRLFYLGKNRNRGFMTEEFASKLLKTLPYTPVVGIYDNRIDDFLGHSIDKEEARTYGVAAANPNITKEKYLDKDGVEREYYCADVILHTGRFSNAKKIIGKKHSLELDKNSIKGEWRKIDGQEYFFYSDARFLGLSVLGDNKEPCFEGSAFFSLIDEYNECLKKINGGREMIINYELSCLNNLFEQLNPLNEEGERIINKIILNGDTEKALIFDLKTKEHSIITFSTELEEQTLTEDSFDKTNDNQKTENETTVVENFIQADYGENIKNAEPISSLLVDATKKKCYELLENKFGSIDKVIENYENLEQKIQEQNNKIVELENNFTTKEIERNSLSEENISLKEKIKEYELKEKEMILQKYEKTISASSYDLLKEKINDFSAIDLEKEILYTINQENPSAAFSSAFFAGVNTSADDDEGLDEISRKIKRFQQKNKNN